MFSRADTEQLLLAGVLGAVVTLLIITLAVAAITIRICLTRKQHDTQPQTHQTDDLHRNGSTRALMKSTG